MKLRRPLALATRGLAVVAATAAASYAALAGITWYRFGHQSSPARDEIDPLLDRFMPSYDVVERHHTRVAAPADVALAAAAALDVQRPLIVRAIFQARALALGSDPDDVQRPRALLPWVQTLGWNVLAEESGREIVVGAVTKPWEANPEFRGLSPGEFLAFDEPGYVKIAWTLRADPISATESVLRHETRAKATDPGSRERFRRYWSFAWPGIFALRPIILRQATRDATSRAARPPLVEAGTA
jgi:hypothetical protein